MREMMRRLKYVRGLEYAADVRYVEFLSRVNRVEEEARRSGSWAAPHPWLNLFVSARDIADFDRAVLKGMLADGVDGPMLIYPMLKSKWDPNTSVALPEGEVFYLVALLRFCPGGSGAAVEELILRRVPNSTTIGPFLVHCRALSCEGGTVESWRQSIIAVVEDNDGDHPADSSHCGDEDHDKGQ
ncbi:unnamed protein product [Triticum turgidum subsp. durum]|uniref:Cytokinin dehydrogenase 1 FAD/cytokinin binding domain-containing protein n=1 Tax=Triticum turgidum subsp. durum TaxID=4567 RepID=A0A9R1ACB4_TRITD|nr:unnamed protein product [Triticum turgidum subsp. durum]